MDLEHKPHLLEFASVIVLLVLCEAYCDTGGDMVAEEEPNLGVGGLEDRGDLIELVEMGVGLAAGALRKTRAGGNWLIGGIVMM